MNELTLGSLWRHEKTGRVYVVLFVAVVATNGSEGHDVVYTRNRIMYTRRVDEFLDGRFTLCHDVTVE